MLRPLIFAAALAFVVAALAGCGGSGDRSAQIASETGASSCEQTSYELINRLDGTKPRIYDCVIDGAEKCVTEESGLTQDVTVEARLLFKATLSGDAPACAS